MRAQSAAGTWNSSTLMRCAKLYLPGETRVLSLADLGMA